LQVSPAGELKVINHASSGSSVVVFGKYSDGNTYVPLAVDGQGNLSISVVQNPGTPIGLCTNPTGDGLVSYDHTQYTTLCSISLLAADTLSISGIYSFGNVQAIVELVTVSASGTRFELVGGFTESAPSFSPILGASNLILPPGEDRDIILRLKALRSKQGQASGRLMARRF
jgi:hypothetical protein